MKISEMITDRYKLRIPPTVYYDLLADVQEVEEEQEPTTKNNFAVDYISRDSAIKALDYDIKCFEFKRGVNRHMDDIAKLLNTIYETQVNNIKALPSTTPQEPQAFKWCTDCKEYDQEKHCCHRWSKVIRDTVGEMKQEYIEREVLDKIRAELHATAEMHDDGDYYLREEWIDEYFDKYKADKEDKK